MIHDVLSPATMLQFIPTRDLLADVESMQWLALDVADDAGSRAYAEHVLALQVAELERRKRLHKARRTDPLRPSWPQSDAAFRARIDAVKAAWPVERFCRELLAVDFERVGPDRLKARCPLPGHDDRTPSFIVTPSKAFAWCFGCNRGGDVLTLTKLTFGLERFTDALTRLERAS